MHSRMLQENPMLLEAMGALLSPNFQAAADSPSGIVFKLGIFSLAAVSEWVMYQSNERTQSRFIVYDKRRTTKSNAWPSPKRRNIQKKFLCAGMI